MFTPKKNPDSVTILGRGLSGNAAARLAALSGIKHQQYTDADNTILPPCPGPIVVSPGIPPDSALYRAAQSSGAPMLSELEFAFRLWQRATPQSRQLAAITGTNGKTTTVELTGHLLRSVGINAIEAGNTGLPFSDVVADIIAGKRPNSLIPVLEVSSFQLELADNFAPTAAVILNIASDHINRYNGGLAAYAAAKLKIFAHTPAGNRIIGATMSSSDFNTATAPARFSCVNDMICFDGRKVFNYQKTSLPGPHNLENLLAALEVTSRFIPHEQVFSEKLRLAACSFHPGAHRLEVLPKRGGVACVNDSKSTNPASVVAALTTVKPKNPKGICLILGGLDKNMDFSPLLDCLDKVKKIFITGACRDKLLALLQPYVACEAITNFDNCVGAAINHAVPGDMLLLSPGCASWDTFTDYRQRGDRFRQLVAE